MMNKIFCYASLFFLLAGCTNKKKKEVNFVAGENWPVYGGNKAGNRYSPLDQINATNVNQLAVAWTYDAREPVDPNKPSRWPKEIQCQPIIINGVLYGTTPELKLFAVDAATGKELWKFVPVKDNQRFNTSRGVMYWEQGDDRRILYSAGGTLYAVDAGTDKASASF